jgi:hypothetical protein
VTPLHVASTLVVALVLAGLSNRRRPPVHRAFMVSAFMIDLLLVLYIEATRHAVETVVTGVHPLLWTHAAISIAVLICYALMIGLGRRLFAGALEVRLTHRNLGIAFCVLRSLNYVTSFFVQTHPGGV